MAAAGNRNSAAIGHRKANRAANSAIGLNKIRNAEIAHADDLRIFENLRAQRLRDRGPRRKEIHIHTARPIMTGRLRLTQMPVRPACPADIPRIELTNGRRPALANQPRQIRIAQTAAGLHRIREMRFPIIRCFFAKRHGDSHLRHDCRTAAPDEAAVSQQHACTFAHRGKRRRHAGRARADHKNIGGEVGGPLRQTHLQNSLNFGGRTRDTIRPSPPIAPP